MQEKRSWRWVLFQQWKYKYRYRKKQLFNWMRRGNG